MIATELLNNIKVTAPCPARWEDMAGDDRCRFCLHCQKNVYNFSVMTAAEVVGLMEEREGKICARIYQRTDGTVMTSACGLGRPPFGSMVRRALVGVAAGLVAVVSAAFGDVLPKGRKVAPPANSNLKQPAQALPHLMGEITCVPPKVTQTNAPIPKPKL